VTSGLPPAKGRCSSTWVIEGELKNGEGTCLQRCLHPSTCSPPRAAGWVDGTRSSARQHSSRLRGRTAHTVPHGFSPQDFSPVHFHTPGTSLGTSLRSSPLPLPLSSASGRKQSITSSLGIRHPQYSPASRQPSPTRGKQTRQRQRAHTGLRQTPAASAPCSNAVGAIGSQL